MRAAFPQFDVDAVTLLAQVSKYGRVAVETFVRAADTFFSGAGIVKGRNVDVQRYADDRTGLNTGKRRLDATDQIGGFLQKNLVPSRRFCRSTIQALPKRRAGGHFLQIGRASCREILLCYE